MKKIILILFVFLLSVGTVSAVSLSEMQSNFHNYQDMHKYSFNSSDLVKTYHNDSQYEIQVLYDGCPVGSGEIVTFMVNGVSYARPTDENGTAALNINLEPGSYVIVSEYNSCKNYNNILVLE